ncbi:uncharacterized protein LOC113367213 [Ctenocephalides felis]|uniref:uncharacterized protein LOC113367213 n=1 Tax=Ctenocephalides felis TaxID=7515 RepID=UPI000E6E4BF7|nr:uncharacterized protein LOC113367213 [Ctenocephalides felis]
MNNAYGNNTIQDLCEDTSTSNLEANNLYMDHAQCIAYQDITVTLTSKLTPTAPEFIPRNAVPFCIVPAQSNNISGAECQDHSASLSQNDQLSRSWWKQYKPSLDTNFIKYSEPYRKWKLLNKEKKIMIDYKHSNQGIINSSPDENMAELNMVSQKLDNAKNYNYKRKSILQVRIDVLVSLEMRLLDLDVLP